jgi:hypothetical protein
VSLDDFLQVAESLAAPSGGEMFTTAWCMDKHGNTVIFQAVAPTEAEFEASLQSLAAEQKKTHSRVRSTVLLPQR